MANITLTGCFDISTGKAKFDLGPACTPDPNKIFYGCLEVSGANAGKIKVVTTGNSDSTCDGTYYGCVNWTTGKFSVDVPEECCTVYGSGDDCKYCTADETPKFIKITFSGVTANIGECCIDLSNTFYKNTSSGLSGSFILEQSGNCGWYYEDWYSEHTTNMKTYGPENPFFDIGPCEDLISNQDPDGITISVDKRASGRVTVGAAHIANAVHFVFDGTPTITDCIACTVSNEFTEECNTDYTYAVCHGGTATIEELW